MKFKTPLLCGALIAFLSGCNMGADSPRGFSLPEGDPEKGKHVLIEHNCFGCHSLDSMEAEVAATQSEITTRVPLGGRSMKITTYAELVTSIINPSHRISRGHKDYTTDADGNSIMPNYNHVMTVDELVNVVAFLQPEYEVVPYTYTRYNQYGPY
ncbi:c-type cytochrome [Ningiella sp. W23]|uniref:c-type cytochrome n=1 Tax=Ningiella sp. W23 TaxID=3023715 RepID=UPI0037581AE9